MSTYSSSIDTARLPRLEGFTNLDHRAGGKQARTSSFTHGFNTWQAGMHHERASPDWLSLTKRDARAQKTRSTSHHPVRSTQELRTALCRVNSGIGLAPQPLLCHSSRWARQKLEIPQRYATLPTTPNRIRFHLNKKKGSPQTVKL